MACLGCVAFNHRGLHLAFRCTPTLIPNYLSITLLLLLPAQLGLHVPRQTPPLRTRFCVRKPTIPSLFCIDQQPKKPSIAFLSFRQSIMGHGIRTTAGILTPLTVSGCKLPKKIQPQLLGIQVVCTGGERTSLNLMMLGWSSDRWLMSSLSTFLSICRNNCRAGLSSQCSAHLVPSNIIF